MRASHDCTTVVRHSRDCLTTVARYSCERLTTVVRHSRECLTTFLRTSAKGWRRVRDGFATYAMTWRRFCDNFCRTKKYYMFKTLATHSRRVRDACEDFAIPCERFATVSRQFATVWRIDSQSIANSSHPSEIGALDIQKIGTKLFL